MNIETLPLLKRILPKVSAKETISLQALSFSEIIFLESSINYTYVYYVDGKRQILAKTLGAFELPLADYGFVRINKSMIVNLIFIRQFFEQQRSSVILSNGHQYLCSRRKTMKVKQAIQNQSNFQ